MSRQDDIENMVYQQEQEAIANANNNEWEYVRQRYVELHARNRYPVRIKAGANVTLTGPFFPVTHRNNVNIQPGPNGKGIEVKLEDSCSGQIGDYRVESNGLNGVEVTRYHGPTRT
ncbi:hypothetical protein [Janthinobacterium lividum]|uniref:hypothetical protein n=1 Tax=Janthinobacterium lividum TaxID=29581 RepID=UPI00140DD150|nr:hypothetical protein [Janthinobacterium lividum]NHQ90305.1 hypothetical protein [Janthinobacterium lividum]